MKRFSILVYVENIIPTFLALSTLSLCHIWREKNCKIFPIQYFFLYLADRLKQTIHQGFSPNKNAPSQFKVNQREL